MQANLDTHSQMILNDFVENHFVFEKMEEIIREKLNNCINENGLYVTAIETRIKEKNSLIGKLERKGQKYKSLSDITDIVGARIITFYIDEVDKVSALVDKAFDVDWNESVDKRKALDLDQFGYMSLHYICRIPKSLYYDPQHPEINEYRFEVQMRSALQHVWATMNHDTGYKSGIEIPREHMRNMNRIAGMLELADEQFSRIRMEIIDYRRNVQALVADGNFNSVPLTEDTFRSYLALNPFKNLIDKIASINQAEIYEDNLICYLDVLFVMQFKTLGDIEDMINNYSEEAYKLALHQFAGTDLDIVALSVAIQNLCTIYIVKQGAGEMGLRLYYNTLYGPSEYNAERAHKTLEQVQKNVIHK